MKKKSYISDVQAKTNLKKKLHTAFQKSEINHDIKSILKFNNVHLSINEKKLGCPLTNIEKFNKQSVFSDCQHIFGIHHYIRKKHGYTMKNLETSSMSPYPDTAIRY